MANLPISGLTASATNLASTDLAPVVQTVGVGPVKMTGLQLAGGLLGSTTFNGSTVTTSQPVLNLTQTWNDGAGGTVTFTGLKFNATDTASASGSRLLDIGTTGKGPKFIVDAKGTGLVQVIGGSIQMAAVDNGSAANTLLSHSGNSTFLVAVRGTNSLALSNVDFTPNLRLPSTFSFGWASDITSNGDTFLTRAATATLQLGAADAAAPVAQTFKVQSGTAGASALSCSISGTTLTVGGAVTGTIAIGHAVTGTGVSAGTVITAGSGASWTVNNSQTVSSTTMYFNSVGADFTIRGSQGSGPSAGGSLIFQVAPAGSAATTAQNAYATAMSLNAVGGSSPYAILGVGTASGYSGFQIQTGGYLGGACFVGDTPTQGTVFGVHPAFAFAWSNGNATPTATYDLFLARDAANTLALKNSTNPQIFRVYSTTTNSNYGYIAAGTTNAGVATSGTLFIGTASSGAPAMATLALQTDSTSRFLVAAGGTNANNPGTIPCIDGADFYTGSGGVVTVRSSTGGYSGANLYSPSDNVLRIDGGTAGTICVNFGGTTSSFPALKRVSANLQVIAADGSSSAGFIVGNQALATTATDGFLYIPTCAGTPTGTPTTQTGTAPLVVDTTNNKLYFYSGGQWRDAGP